MKLDWRLGVTYAHSIRLRGGNAMLCMPVCVTRKIFWTPAEDPSFSTLHLIICVLLHFLF
jgi:hypothetical protein